MKDSVRVTELYGIEYLVDIALCGWGREEGRERGREGLRKREGGEGEGGEREENVCEYT